jgi:2,3-bisphosphoglycerate-dependent phosphoglycerate mutase
MYGGLQGLNKSETAEKHGEEQVKVWRRSYITPPPPIDEESPMNPVYDPKYKNIPRELLPRTECLKDTVERFLPFWDSEIAPAIKSGKRVLIAAHGNTLRALVCLFSFIREVIYSDMSILVV